MAMVAAEGKGNLTRGRVYTLVMVKTMDLLSANLGICGRSAYIWS